MRFILKTGDKPYELFKSFSELQFHYNTNLYCDLQFMKL